MSAESIKSKNLLEAIQKGREEEVEARLRSGENVNSVFVMNRTPLHCAVANKMTRIVEKLLKHNPDVTVSKIEINLPSDFAALLAYFWSFKFTQFQVHVSR